jgi:1-acyl-sn-glycerol-3-phosphate acyltransferase
MFRVITRFWLKILATVIWWPVLFLGALCFAFLLAILPRRLRNGVGLHIAALVLIKVAGVKVDVQGLENIDTEGPQIIVANHQSLFDSFVLGAILRIPLTFASKKELFKVPVYRNIMHLLGFIRVDRANPRDIVKDIGTITTAVRSGPSLVVFPEGAISKTGELGTFKRGAVLFANKARVPIVPVSLTGTRDIKQPGRFWINYGVRVKVIILPSVEVDVVGKKKQNDVTKMIENMIAYKLNSGNKY